VSLFVKIDPFQEKLYFFLKKHCDLLLNQKSENFIINYLLYLFFFASDSWGKVLNEALGAAV
jgi:hypothetical protein